MSAVMSHVLCVICLYLLDACPKWLKMSSGKPTTMLTNGTFVISICTSSYIQPAAQSPYFFWPHLWLRKIEAIQRVLPHVGAGWAHLYLDFPPTMVDKLSTPRSTASPSACMWSLLPFQFLMDFVCSSSCPFSLFHLKHLKCPLDPVSLYAVISHLYEAILLSPITLQSHPVSLLFHTETLWRSV